MEIDERPGAMGSYDNGKKVRAGSYQVDPIPMMVRSKKQNSKIIKEEVCEESSDGDAKKQLKKSKYRLNRSRSFDGIDMYGKLMD